MGLGEFTPIRSQMEGDISFGSSVIAPNLPSAIAVTDQGTITTVIDTTSRPNTGYDVASEMIFDFQPFPKTVARRCSIGIVGNFQGLTLYRSRVTITSERVVRYE